MTGTIKHFFASGNTSRGFINLYESSLQGLERLYILSGGLGTGKSSLIRSIGEHFSEAGYDIWYIHCPSDNESLDGVIIQDVKVGIVDGSPPRVIEPKLPESALKYVNLNEACDPNQLNSRKSDIESLTEGISQAHQRAYSGYAEALRIHDEWEALYIESMNFQAADDLTQEYIHLLYGDRKLARQSRVDYRFLGAATPKGAVDFVPNLTAGLKRYLIKGRPGSGKSTMLKKIAAAGMERGLDVEIYRCGLDPNSLDMIIVPQLAFAMFDSTAPHEYFPDRSTDEIVDMYARCIQPGTDEAIADAMTDIKKRYSTQMKLSTQHLAHAKSLQDELAEIYSSSVNHQLIDQIKREIQQEIVSIAAAND